MKNVLKAFGLIVLVAVIGFSFAACDTGGDDGGVGSNLAGTTWKCTQDGVTYTLTFTATTVMFVNDYNTQIVSGTYTLNGSSGTFFYNNIAGETFVVNGNTLTLIGNGISLTFIKVTGGGGTPTTQSLDGVWERGGMQVTVSGSTGVYSYLNSSIASGVALDAINKGYLQIGTQAWRNLTSTGNLTWSGESFRIQYYTSSPNVAIGTTWGSSTFIMSANGQTLTVDGSETWTRK
jgi:hypothetical protein